MSEFPRLDPAKYAADWEKAIDTTRAFSVERPAMFSPAGAAQDASNRSRMLWSWAPLWLPWEYSDWLEEGRSFHDSAYIGDWSALVKIKITGPDAFAFLEYVGTNDLSDFAIGRVKHHVQVDENGKIAAQGVLYRVGEEEFHFTGGSAYWTYFVLEQGDWDAEREIVTAESFLFSVQGPRSRDIMERATGADLKHMRFNDWQEFPIGDAPVRLLRTGVTGGLGYELHGPVEHGNDVWSTIVELGQEFGIRELGVRAQLISHVEAGIATNDRDFVSAAAGTGGQPQIKPTARSKILGSYQPADLAELHRTPAEVGWFRQMSLDSHDFLGRDALLAERDAGGPNRRLTGLIWNPQDVTNVYATLFEDDPARPMDLPRHLGLAVDEVHAGGSAVGCSTSRVYSPFFKQMISLGYLDKELCEPGTEVSIIWGDPGKRQVEIRATVTDIPFKPDTRRK